MTDPNKWMQASALIVKAYARGNALLSNDQLSAYERAINSYSENEDADTMAELAVQEVAPWLNPSWEDGRLVLDFDD